jgi:hypothetical protein
VHTVHKGIDTGNGVIMLAVGGLVYFVSVIHASEGMVYFMTHPYLKG